MLIERYKYLIIHRVLDTIRCLEIKLDDTLPIDILQPYQVRLKIFTALLQATKVEVTALMVFLLIFIIVIT